MCALQSLSGRPTATNDPNPAFGRRRPLDGLVAKSSVSHPNPTTTARSEFYTCVSPRAAVIIKARDCLVQVARCIGAVVVQVPETVTRHRLVPDDARHVQRPGLDLRRGLSMGLPHCTH
eukprot:2933577-Prymnesium_polylepis.1